MSMRGLPAIIEKPIIGLTSWTSSIWTNFISQAITGGMSTEFIELVKGISEVKSQQVTFL